MNAKIVTVILIFVSYFRLCECKRYDNYSYYKAVPTEIVHIKFLQNIENQKYIDLIFWKKPHKLFEEVHFIVSKKDEHTFLERAKHFGFEYELILSNVQTAFDAQSLSSYRRLRVETYSWNFYHRLEDINQWLADIALKYPHSVELQKIGQTNEGRDIFVLCIKSKKAKGNVIVEGGIHGNEWISIEFVTYLADQLVKTNTSNDRELMTVANSYNWYLIPVLNPDGFVYSQNVDRLWKKNRKGKYGVDLNRNFDYKFSSLDSSVRPYDDNYCGPSPFSEPETRALADFITKKSADLKFYFSFHAYGQKIIIPFSDRVVHVDNYSEMENYGKQAVIRMYKMNHVKYSVGTTYDTLGLRISGNSASWVKKNFKVRYVFTFLLRDNGTYGYALPIDQILPTCKETLAGILEIMTARPRKMRANIVFTSSSQSRNWPIFLLLLCVMVLLKMMQ